MLGGLGIDVGKDVTAVRRGCFEGHVDASGSSASLRRKCVSIGECPENR